MARNRVTVTSNVRDVNKRLENILGAKVGYLAETTGKQTYDNGLTLAANAAIHELGKGNVPPRPFMTQGADAFEKDQSLAQDTLKRAVAGDLTGDQASNRLGVLLQTEIRKAIRAGNFTPLQPETIARKGSSSPLIDTGRLRQGVDVRTK